MRSLITFCLSLFLCAGAHAQVFWAENFETGAATGLLVSSYTSPNGSWTLTTGSEGGQPNPWYVSCEEAGHLGGDCGSTCASSAGLGASLHIGASAILIGDAGATYDAGGLFNTLTDRRAESPAISCIGKSNITIRFYYIENGDGANDDGLVWYYDGSAWSMLVNTAKTPTCGGGQGTWAMYSAVLPASANNNANVKIGFQWVNNNDGVGTDPSFAIDSLSLSTTGTTSVPTPSFTLTPNPVCQDSCVTFTNTTVGTVDSFRWMVVGVPYTANTSPYQLCLPSVVPPGTYTMRLYVFLGGAVDSVDQTFTVNPAPHPAITRSGNTFSVAGTYTSYQWFNGATSISGATSASYTTTVKGAYSVVVDSGGCKGTATISTLAAGNISNAAQSIWVAQANNNIISLFAAAPLDEALTVTVFDATGRMLESQPWTRGSSALQMNADFFASGLYLIKLTGRGSSYVLRWQKQ